MPKAIARKSKATSAIIIQKTKPLRFRDTAGPSACVDIGSGFKNGLPKGFVGGGEPASFKVSASLSGSCFGFGTPCSGAESLVFSLKSGLEGVLAVESERGGEFWKPIG